MAEGGITEFNDKDQTLMNMEDRANSGELQPDSVKSATEPENEDQHLSAFLERTKWYAWPLFSLTILQQAVEILLRWYFSYYLAWNYLLLIKFIKPTRDLDPLMSMGLENLSNASHFQT